MFKLDNKPVSIYQDLTVGEGEDAITYPAGSLQDAATREALGIVEVPDEVRPDDRFYFVHDNGDGTFGKEPKPLDMVKAIKLAEIASNRYNREVGGVTLADGAKIRTDRESQALVASALLRVQRNPGLLIDWKGENGWVQIGKAQVEAVADAVGDHVQACFSAERVKVEALEALTDFDAVLAFDTSMPA